MGCGSSMAAQARRQLLYPKRFDTMCQRGNELLGEGRFARVTAGTWLEPDNTRPVAIKTVSDLAVAYQELEILHQVGDKK